MLDKIKEILIRNTFARELFFFLFQKKVYKKNIDKKICDLLNGKLKLSKDRMNSLVISLTSFPERIDEIKYTIFSLLDQTILPKKIILWLSESQFPGKEKDLPFILLNLKKCGLEINWTDNIKSYKKLIPPLIQYPDYFIATADDDIYYERNWLEKIWQEHLKYPNEYICHLARKIKFDKNGNLLSYKKWPSKIRSSNSSFLNFPIGCAGGLYHRNYLFSDILNKKLFFELTPYADDIWFYFMLVKGNTRIRVVRNPCNKLKYVNPYREYNLVDGYKLSSINVHNNQNDVYFEKILNYYHIDLASLI